MTLDWEEDRTWRRVFEPTSKPAKDESDDSSVEEKPLTTRKCMIDISDWGDI